jgi:hypothetical protein
MDKALTAHANSTTFQETLDHRNFTIPQRHLQVLSVRNESRMSLAHRCGLNSSPQGWFGWVRQLTLFTHPSHALIHSRDGPARGRPLRSYRRLEQIINFDVVFVLLNVFCPADTVVLDQLSPRTCT